MLTNADVARAALVNGGESLDFASRHYETYGWHEGRNPNLMFDTQGYLAAYKDVAVAGLDPLTHHAYYGWHEGRAPSVGFDTKAYGAAYVDVAVAGLDLMAHYLQWGPSRAEAPSGTAISPDFRAGIMHRGLPCLPAQMSFIEKRPALW